LKREDKTSYHKLISARGRSAKMSVNGIRTHACTNQRRTLDRGRGNPSTKDGFNYLSDIAALS